MDYYKYTFTLTPDNESFRDVLAHQLSDYGFDSFFNESDKFEAFVPSNKDVDLKDIDTYEMFEFSFEKEFIKDQNWNKKWEENYFEPLQFRTDCIVRAPFHESFPDVEYEIIIEPNMSFGTGNHETTQLIMDQIFEMDLQSKDVLDMGCGTGILSILSSKRGAKSILAADIDTWCYESVSTNATFNGVENIKSKLGSVEVAEEQTFDVILANIHKNIIIEHLPNYSKMLRPGGIVVVSGFYEDDRDDVHAVAQELGLTFKADFVRNSWTSLSFCKI